MGTKKISQNIQTLIGEIGERMCLFKLYERISHGKDLEIYKNYSESGYDIGIGLTNCNKENGNRKKVRIEVKTRQHLITTTNKKHICRFTLTEIEKNNADFLIAYWLEFNNFFIVPMNSTEIKERKSKDKKVFQFSVRKMKKKENPYSENAMPYLEKWETLQDFIDGNES